MRVVRRAAARALVGLALAAGGGRAQGPVPPPARGLTLDEVLAAARRANRDLRVARAASDSARAEVRVARALPNPTASAVPNTPFQYGLTLPLDVGPQRTFRGRASLAGAAAAGDDARDAERQVTLAVRRAFYDVLLADARRALVADRRRVVAQLAASDSARVRAGDVPERNLVRSEVELARTDADLARAGVDAQTARLTLQLLMGAERPDTAFAVVGSLAYRPAAGDSLGADALVPRALAQRPDLAAGAERVRQSRALGRLAAASLVPVPQLNYVRQFSAPFATGRYSAVGVGVELPFFNAYAGQRARAAAGARAAEAGRERLALQAERDVRSALADHRAQRALVERFEAGLLARIGRNVAAARYAYERGATSLLDVLDAARAEQDVRTDYVTALHDYWVSAAALDAATGGPSAGRP